MLMSQSGYGGGMGDSKVSGIQTGEIVYPLVKYLHVRGGGEEEEASIAYHQAPSLAPSQPTSVELAHHASEFSSASILKK